MIAGAIRRYAQGALTAERWRFLDLPRYALPRRLPLAAFTSFFALCFVYPLVCAILIYLKHNAAALQPAGNDRRAGRRPSTPPSSAGTSISRGRGCGFLLAIIVGPSLVAPDLRNNGLALYLLPPASRARSTCVGKMTVLGRCCRR